MKVISYNLNKHKAIGELDAEIAALEERWFVLTELLG